MSDKCPGLDLFLMKFSTKVSTLEALLLSNFPSHFKTFSPILKSETVYVYPAIITKPLPVPVNGLCL